MYVKTKTLNFSLSKRRTLLNVTGLHLVREHNYGPLFLQKIFPALEKLIQIAK